MPDDYKFTLIGADTKSPFLGYFSTPDPTTLTPAAMVAGSQNVFKTKKGTVEVRPGLKRFEDPNSAETAVVSSFEWETSVGMDLPLRVLEPTPAGDDGKLQFESTIADGVTPIWYDLMTVGDLTRLVFDTWWDIEQSRDLLLFVKGDSTLNSWSGGIAKIANIQIRATGFATAAVHAGSAGAAYQVNDILFITGGNGDATVIVTGELGGAVEGVSILNPGTGYTSGTFGVTGGSGTGLQLDMNLGDVAYVTKTGTETWAEVGFSPVVFDNSHGTINNGFRIGVNDYFYTAGEGTTTLIVFDTSIISEAIGSIAIQTVVITSPSPVAGFINDFIKVFQNQLYVGSYSSRLVYSSADDDYLNFTNHGSHVSGDPDLMTFDANLKGLGEHEGKLAVFAGIDNLYLVTTNVNVTVSYTGSDGNTRFAYNQVVKIPLAGLSAALAHEFIGNLGSYLIWVDQNNQLRTLGNFTNNFAAQPSYLSLAIWDELKAEDLTGGHLRVVTDTIYITAPLSGITRLYVSRETINGMGQIVAERLWQPPQVWNISRIAVINGLEHGHSNQNPQTYQLWDTDQWHDDTPHVDATANYASKLRLAYERGPEGTRISFSRLLLAGYIVENGDLNADIVYDFEGSTKIRSGGVQDADHPFTGGFFKAPVDGIVGGEALGSEIGGGDGAEFPEFISIINLTQIQCFKYYVEIWSDTADSRWALKSVGVNLTGSHQLPTFIQQKLIE